MNNKNDADVAGYVNEAAKPATYESLDLERFLSHAKNPIYFDINLEAVENLIIVKLFIQETLDYGLNLFLTEEYSHLVPYDHKGSIHLVSTYDSVSCPHHGFGLLHTDIKTQRLFCPRLPQ